MMDIFRKAKAWARENDKTLFQYLIDWPYWYDLHLLQIKGLRVEEHSTNIRILDGDDLVIGAGYEGDTKNDLTEKNFHEISRNIHFAINCAWKYLKNASRLP